jgi:hypothetical protein
MLLFGPDNNVRTIFKILRIMKIKLLIAFLLLTIAASAQEVETEANFEIGLSNQFFFNEGAYEGQKRNYLSLSITPDFSVEWKEGNQGLYATVFLRLFQHDTQRTHWDIRELYYQNVAGRSELSAGLRTVFWGVTESAHLVDIINQTDALESFDGEKKLGQPMIKYSYAANFGTFDFYYLPVFRPRIYPGVNGRLRTPIILDGKDFDYESSAGQYHQDFSVRYSHYIGVFDFGLSYFRGTGREPIVTSIEQFNPVWGIIDQIGLELQATTGPVLWKFESIIRKNSMQDVEALVAGVEYTFSNISNSGIDIGVLAEYLYDSRGELALSSMQNDIFFGARLAFNDMQDTQILVGGIVDLDHSSKIWSIEASRRIKDSWKIELEGRFFQNISNSEFLYVIKEDSFAKLTILKYF